MNLVTVVIFSIGVQLVLHNYMSISIRLCLSKNEWRCYIRNTGFLDRWFFWSAPQIIRNKYSKRERKMIRYSSMAKAYRMLNIAIHFLGGIELVIVLSYHFEAIHKAIFEWWSIMYFIICFLLFVILSIIELIVNHQYHRSRHRNRS